MTNAAAPSDPHASTGTVQLRATHGLRLPRLADLPIPPDIAVSPDWPEQMREMADWIGACDTLRVSAALGGRPLYVSRDPERSPFRGILTPAKCALMAEVYGTCRLTIATALPFLRRARRAGVIASVRAGLLSVVSAAAICETSRTYMASLVNQTTEGIGVAPIELPEPAALALLKDAADTVVRQLAAANVDPAIVGACYAAILALWDAPQQEPAPSVKDPVLRAFLACAEGDHGA